MPPEISEQNLAALWWRGLMPGERELWMDELGDRPGGPGVAERAEMIRRPLSRAEIAALNAGLPAGSPMVFSCRRCGHPIWVPECYVAKPALCEACGGEWSEGPLPWLTPGETRKTSR